MPVGGNTIRNISNICQNSRLSSSCPSREFAMNKCFLIITTALLCMTSCSRTEYVDVLVIGGGASGIAAGIQSARMGVPAMVVEETPWVGGMLTAAGVSCVDGNYGLQSGLFGEFADSLAARIACRSGGRLSWQARRRWTRHGGWC